MCCWVFAASAAPVVVVCVFFLAKLRWHKKKFLYATPDTNKINFYIQIELVCFILLFVFCKLQMMRLCWGLSSRL